MRRLATVYPDYVDRVAFYAVGVDPFETLDDLEEYRNEKGHPWPVALPEGRTISALRVTVQSTKIAVDHRGIITYRDGYGRGDETAWRRVMSELAERVAR